MFAQAVWRKWDDDSSAHIFRDESTSFHLFFLRTCYKEMRHSIYETCYANQNWLMRNRSFLKNSHITVPLRNWRNRYHAPRSTLFLGGLLRQLWPPHSLTASLPIWGILMIRGAAILAVCVWRNWLLNVNCFGSSVPSVVHGSIASLTSLSEAQWSGTKLGILVLNTHVHLADKSILQPPPPYTVCNKIQHPLLAPGLWNEIAFVLWWDMSLSTYDMATMMCFLMTY